MKFNKQVIFFAVMVFGVYQIQSSASSSAISEQNKQVQDYSYLDVVKSAGTRVFSGVHPSAYEIRETLTATDSEKLEQFNTAYNPKNYQRGIWLSLLGVGCGVGTIFTARNNPELTKPLVYGSWASYGLSYAFFAKAEDDVYKAKLAAGLIAKKNDLKKDL